MDVSDESSVEVAAEENAGLGRLHGVVANAGNAWLGPTLAMPVAEWQRVIATNLDGSFHTACAFGS